MHFSYHLKQPPANAKVFGQIAEKLSLKLLKKNGYRLIKKNFYTHYGEIDLIVQNQQHVVFIEVRARKAGSLVSPLDSINTAKCRRITTSAKLFLVKNPHLQHLDCRFDVVSVINHGMIMRFQWLKNVI